MNNIFAINIIAVILLFCIGLYTLIASKNMLRMLIGFEVMAKGVTLAIISAGYSNGRIVLSQVLTITVIVVEVIFVAIALGIIMLIYRKKQSLHLTKLEKPRGE
jgi:NADH-quinone oxidoreductase subunit K